MIQAIPGSYHKTWTSKAACVTDTRQKVSLFVGFNDTKLSACHPYSQEIGSQGFPSILKSSNQPL